MRNRAFYDLSADERRDKLRAAVREISGGLLLGRELDAILRAAVDQKQYVVAVYRELPTMLADTVRIPRDRLSCVLDGETISMESLEKAAAEETPLSAVAAIIDSGSMSGGMLYLYIPPQRERKKDKNESQRQTETLRLRGACSAAVPGGAAVHLPTLADPASCHPRYLHRHAAAGVPVGQKGDRAGAEAAPGEIRNDDDRAG